jgi:hypothetical protein
MRTLRLAFVVLAVSVLLALDGLAARPSPTITLGKSIGGVSIGERAARVRAVLGPPAKTEVYARQSRYEWSRATYPVGLWSLWVSFGHGVVVAVETSSPFFRLDIPPPPTIESTSPPATAGVGSRIYGGFSGECDVLGYEGACDPWLIGFTWSEDCQAWVEAYRGIASDVSLLTDPDGSAILDANSRGTVHDILIGLPAYTIDMLDNSCAE